jgi:hypothetical protein
MWPFIVYCQVLVQFAVEPDRIPLAAALVIYQTFAVRTLSNTHGRASGNSMLFSTTCVDYVLLRVNSLDTFNRYAHLYTPEVLKTSLLASSFLIFSQRRLACQKNPQVLSCWKISDPDRCYLGQSIRYFHPSAFHAAPSKYTEDFERSPLRGLACQGALSLSVCFPCPLQLENAAILPFLMSERKTGGSTAKLSADAKRLVRTDLRRNTSKQIAAATKPRSTSWTSTTSAPIENR